MARTNTSSGGGGGGVTDLNGLTGAVTLSEGSGIFFDTTGNDIAINVIGSTVPSDTTLAVKVATTAALPGTPTYDNGTAGVGATLTRSSNGTTGTIDGVTAANLMAGDYILVKNQAAQLQNGVYEVTQQGTASLPYILTRVTEADTTAELDDLVVTAALGSTNKGVPYGQQTNNPTIGVSNIVFTATGIYMRQQTTGTQAINQIPVYTGTALTQTKGTANFKYNPTNDLFTIRGIDYTFPANNGDASQVLTTDGSGTLSWASAGGGSPITIGTAGNTLYSSGLSGTGQGDTSAGQNIILGVSAGASASGAYNVNFLGQNAGNAATNAYESNFLGLDAGRNASSANDSNFLGFRAGYGATSAQRSNFLGYNSGNGASGAYQSNFFGYEAGLTASSAGTSNFIGYLAGRLATNAANSNFMGNNAGSGATNAANSIFIGKFAGSSDTVSITGASTDSAILIGSSTSTGGFKNSVAIGNGATNTAANEFLVSAPTQPFTSMAFITSSAGFFRRDAGIVDSRVTTVAYGSTTNLTAGHYDIQVTTSTGATTINLPTGTTSPIGTTYIIKDLDAIAVTSNITIDAGSGNTINAATIAQTYVIAISGECVKLKKVTSTAWAIE